MLEEQLRLAQEEICRRYSVPCFPSHEHLKAGVAANARDPNVYPINGLRHPPAGDTTGWYIWSGEELPSNPDFFRPLHVRHLEEWCPKVLPYLGLPPGWRFLIAPNYEDVWYDPALLET